MVTSLSSRPFPYFTEENAVLKRLILLGLTTAIIWSPVNGADTATDFGLGAGYTDNLFNDSTAVHDSYTSPYLNLKLYPTSSMEIGLSGAYHAYRENVDLSSLTAGGSLTLVKVDENQPLSLFFSAGGSLQKFGELYRDYDHFQSDLSASARYRIASKVQLKIGGVFSSSVYSNSAAGDNYGYGAFVGLNSSFWGSNTIDIEGGVDLTRFTGLENSSNTAVRGWRSMMTESSTLETDLQTAYVSLRYSRALGNSSGLSLEYAARTFIGNETVATYGLTIDNLSPWTSFWEGQAVSAEIKTFLLPGFIVTGGGRYRNAQFMDALEADNTADEVTYTLQSREDDQVQAYFGLKRPFVVAPGRILSPTLNLSYIDNSSTHPFYDFSSFGAALSLNLQF
jgi:hypothetical protein